MEQRPTDCSSVSGVVPGHSPPPPPSPEPSPSPPAPLPPAPKGGYKNVLFIPVDDLRPEVGAYGHAYMKTPHLDQLAAEGTIFTRAYVQYSFCGPSRNSFMTGRRPDATKAFSFMNHFREEGAGQTWKSMPQWFKENGFFTTGAGKLFHPGLPPNFDAPLSWQKFVYPGSCTGATNGWPVLDPKVAPMVHCIDAGSCESKAVTGGDSNHWCSFNPKKVTTPIEDELVLSEGIALLREAAEGLKEDPPRPFFLGVGFHKPHMPFYFPDEYGDLYPIDTVLPPLHPNPPEGMPLVAWHEGNFGNNTWGHPAQDSTTFRRAYYSAVSYTDYHIGMMLAELDTLGLKETTVVAVMGDHGWQLGEMNEWRKMSNFELGVRVPLIIRTPWLPNSVGVKMNALAEAVDLFPTFSALAGLPALPSDQTLQGSSLVPLLVEPGNTSHYKQYAFSQFAKALMFSSELQKQVGWNVCTTCKHNTIDFMGYSIRDDNWRYTLWLNWNKTATLPLWDSVEGEELYNHTGDYGASMDAATPVRNQASDQGLQAVKAVLKAALITQFKGDHLPPAAGTDSTAGSLVHL